MSLFPETFQFFSKDQITQFAVLFLNALSANALQQTPASFLFVLIIAGNDRRQTERWRGREAKERGGKQEPGNRSQSSSSLMGNKTPVLPVSFSMPVSKRLLQKLTTCWPLRGLNAVVQVHFMCRHHTFPAPVDYSSLNCRVEMIPFSRVLETWFLPLDCIALADHLIQISPSRFK